jgi:hypothetical protein
MTQQYVAGELSLLLAMLQDVADGDDAAVCAAALRLEAESRPTWVLAGVEIRALALAEGLCWASLQRGDAVAFERQARMAARLLEFGVCAGLLSPGDRAPRD